MDLCKKINAKDNDPPYRDEQRAWYDTIKGFLHSIKGLQTTVTLYAKDFAWCSLDPSNPRDVERFKSMLKGEWGIKIREEPNSSLARIIIAIGREWDGNAGAARKLFEKILKECLK